LCPDVQAQAATDDHFSIFQLGTATKHHGFGGVRLSRKDKVKDKVNYP
jgi:hypothetical protein